MAVNLSLLTRQLKALAEPKRMKIVELLSRQEMSAGELLSCFEVKQPTLSHDMRVLLEAQLVILRRCGKHAYYRLNEAQTRTLAQELGRIMGLRGASAEWAEGAKANA